MKQKDIEKNNLDFIVNISKFNMVLTKTLDSKLGGLGFNDFIVLYHLSKANDQKLKRIELAEKVGLTASGITRLLLPMEKIGLINKETNSQDARISYVSITLGGKTKLDEALERLNYFIEEIIDKDQSKKLNDLTKILQKIGGKIMWK